MDKQRRTKMIRLGGATLLVVLGVLSIVAPAKMGALLGHQWLTEKAVSLVDDTLANNQKAFLTLSGIKAGLAVIEGSSVGVGFELEIGDVVQPALDYVDFFWRIFLFAFLITGGYKLLMETGLLDIGFLLVGIGLLAAAATLVQAKWKRGLRKTARRCILFGLLIAYVVPLALHTTHFVKVHYTSGLEQEYTMRMSQFHVQINRTQDQFIQLKEEMSFLQPTESVNQITNRITTLTKSLSDAFNASFAAFVYYVVLMLFDILFLPLLSAFIIYKFAGFALGRALDEILPARAKAGEEKPQINAD